MVKSNLLIHELQLGEQLNKCVHSHRRSDFSLMIAMLADDVREHSQFHVPQLKVDDKEYNNELLRKEFQLPDEAPLGLTEIEDIERYNQADLVEGMHVADIHLLNALNPPALAFRDDKTHIPTPVISNTSLYCQHKYKQNNKNSLNHRATFNAKEWLSTVNETIVKAPMVA